MLYRLLAICGLVSHAVDWALKDRRRGLAIRPKRVAGNAKWSAALLMAGVCGVAAGIALVAGVGSAGNQTLNDYSINQLAAFPDLNGKTYARVTGTLMGDDTFSYSSGGKLQYVQLVVRDRQGSNALIVHTKKNASQIEALTAADGTITLTGTLAVDPSGMSDALMRAETDTSVDVNTRILLNEGDAPLNPTLMYALAGVFGVLALILLVGWAIGYVIFRPMSTHPSLSTQGMAGPLAARVTGLVIGFRGGDRALEMPVALVVPPPNPADPAVPRIALVWGSGADAKGLPIVPGTTEMAMGTAYPVGGARPALRLRCEGYKLVLTFDTGTARDEAFDQIRLAGGLMASAQGSSAALTQA